MPGLVNSSGDRAQKKQHKEFLAKELASLLNHQDLRPLAFGRRHLWENLAGNKNYGSILYEIVIYHFPSSNGEVKLKTWDDETDCYLFWHTAWQLAEKTNLSQPTVRRGIKRLKQLGLIGYKIKQNDFGRPCYHLYLKFENFFSALIQAARGFSDHLYKMIKWKRSLCTFSIYILNIFKKNKNIEEENFSSNQQQKKEVIAKTSRPEPISILDNFNLFEETNIPQVDEKVNKEIITRKSMANHQPEGDRFFNSKQIQPQIRERSLAQSAVGMSRLKDLNHLQQCLDALTDYFALKHAPEKAVYMAQRDIEEAKKGKISRYVKDFLENKPVGSWCQQEWEIVPGVVVPILSTYLHHTLAQKDDTHARTVERVAWQLKDPTSLAIHWRECKRLLSKWKPKYYKAIELGQNPLSLNVPSWIVETLRPETPIEEAAESAQILGAIATEQLKQSQQFQAIAPKQDEDIPVLIPGGITGNESLVELRSLLKPMPQAIPEELLTTEQEIDQLLKDPITRPRGVYLAKQKGLSLLLNEGVAVGIDFEATEINHQKEEFTTTREKQDKPNQEDSPEVKAVFQGKAYKVYQSETIEKGSKDAWSAAKAKSKFLKNRGFA